MKVPLPHFLSLRMSIFCHFILDYNIKVMNDTIRSSFNGQVNVHPHEIRAGQTNNGILCSYVDAGVLSGLGTEKP